jgi:outer membrane lipoprotein
MPKLLIVSVLFALSACATAPTTPTASIQNPPSNDVAFAQAKGNPQQFLQTPVRWGGTIVDRKKHGEHIQLEIVQRPLDDSGKPKLIGKSAGSFIVRIPTATAPRQLDPGRSLTVYGPISGAEKDSPIVTADAHHLWRSPRNVVVVHNGRHAIMEDHGRNPAMSWDDFFRRNCRHLHTFYYDCNI